MANEIDDPSFHTAAIPRLYDEYVQAMAKVNSPKHDEAIHALSRIIERAQNARALICDMKAMVD